MRAPWSISFNFGLQTFEIFANFCLFGESLCRFFGAFEVYFVNRNILKFTPPDHPPRKSFYIFTAIDGDLCAIVFRWSTLDFTSYFLADPHYVVVENSGYISSLQFLQARGTFFKLTNISFDELSPAKRYPLQAFGAVYKFLACGFYVQAFMLLRWRKFSIVSNLFPILSLFTNFR